MSEQDGTSGASRRGASETPITFSEFVMSIGMNAMAMLDTEGELVPTKADLVQAAQHIDILRLLKDRTRGNLDEGEQKLLESLLYDLQMRYLEVARAAGPELGPGSGAKRSHRRRTAPPGGARPPSAC